MKPGDCIKVLLPGERPWAEIISLTNNGFIGRLDNTMFHERSEFEQAQLTNGHFGTVKKLPKKHSYKKNDVVEFYKTENGWEPKP